MWSRYSRTVQLQGAHHEATHDNSIRHSLFSCFNDRTVRRGRPLFGQTRPSAPPNTLGGTHNSQGSDAPGKNGRRCLHCFIEDLQRSRVGRSTDRASISTRYPRVVFPAAVYLSGYRQETDGYPLPPQAVEAEYY